MNAIYKRWLLLNVNQLMRHMAVALTTWAGTSVADGKIIWKGLGAAILFGAFIPTFTAFLAKGIPGADDLPGVTDPKPQPLSITPHENPPPANPPANSNP
jgi:hypothetical protein